MYIIDTEIEKVCEEFSQVEKWIKTIHKKVLKTEVDNSKIQTYYSYGFFVTKPKEGEVVLTNDDIFKLKFKKRLKFELSKVRVDVTIKIGNFTMTNRLEKGTIPEDIKNIVTEITKVRMMVEGEYHQNKKVIQSIPEVDSKIVQYRIIRGDEDVDMEPMFDIDLILDKISKDGIQSLSPEEKDFLDKSSKHL
jgi:aconitase B